MRSPTSGSPDRKVVEAPPWLRRLLTPLFARHVARAMIDKGVSAEQIAEKMRAELGHPPSPFEQRMIQEVASRVPREAEKPVSAWILVAANLVPVVGVLFWGWNVFALLALFWMENVVVGVFFILRMLSADPADPALWLGKLFMIPFFCFHYGMFTAVHGFFVFHLFGDKKYDVADPWRVLEPAARVASDYGLWIPVALLFASHAFSFLSNYLWRGEYRRVQLARLMTSPYARVVALHVAIILGGIGVAALGSPVWALLILVTAKIAIDLTAHLKEHSKA